MGKLHALVMDNDISYRTRVQKLLEKSGFALYIGLENASTNIVTRNILNSNNHKGDFPAVSCLLSNFFKNLIAGKKIVFGTGGYIFSNNHIPGKDSNPNNASGVPKDNEDNKNIFMCLTVSYYN